MAINSFLGNAALVAKVVNVTPVAPVTTGQIYTVWCNLKPAWYQAVAGDGLSQVAAGLALALQTASQTIPEFADFAATSSGAVVTLTATTAGVPYDIAVTTSANLTVAETTVGIGALNEIHQISLLGNYSGGTFTITYSFGTTAAIAYNATAATVQAAIVALAGVGAGQAIVTGGPGPGAPWIVEWAGTLAATSVAVGTINGASLTGNGSVQVTHTQAGAGLSSSIQSVDVSASAGGTFTLAFAGQTTAAINFGASAATIQTALQGLSTIGSGGCTVYGAGTLSGPGTDTNFHFVQFTGALAGVNVPLITGNFNNLSGTGSTSMLQLGGQTTTNAWQFVDLNGSAAGTFSLTYNGSTTAAIPVIAPPGTNLAGNVQIALAALPSPNVLAVFGAGTHLTGQPGSQFLVKFGSTSPAAVPVLTVNAANLLPVNTGQTVTVLSDGRANLNDIQQIVIFGTGGTFTLTAGAQTTAAMAFNVAFGTLQTRIQTDLNNTFTAVTTSGLGTLASPYIVTTTNPANTNIAAMTGTGTSLTGGGGTIAELVHGAAGVNEVQTVTLAAGVSGGTFLLSFLGAQTAALAWNASAGTVQAALRALSTINGANVNVAGGGPWTVTYVGTLAGAPQPLLIADGSLLTGATTSLITLVTTVASSGPNHYDAANNWSLGHVPNTLENVVFDMGSADCLYGLNQIAVVTANAATDTVTWALGAGGSAGNGYTSGSFVAGQTVFFTNAGGGLPGGLATGTTYFLVNVNRDAGTAQLSATLGGSAIDITTAGTGTQTMGVRLASIEDSLRWNGALGLPRVNANNYAEYRPRYLHIGLATTGQGGTQTVTIGTQSGTGSGKVQINTDVDQAAFLIVASGSSIDQDARDVLLKTSNASSTLEQLGGDVAVAMFEVETSTLASVKLRDGRLELGPNCTVTGPVTRTGGTLVCDGCTINGAVTV